MTDDIQVYQDHSILIVIDYEGARRTVCACGLWALDSDDFVNGMVPPEMDRCQDDCPNKESLSRLA